MGIRRFLLADCQWANIYTCIAANVGMKSSADSELKSAYFNADSSADHGKIGVWVWALSLKLL